MMELTQKEKEIVVQILEKHIEEVQKNEELTEDFAKWATAEVKYEKLLQDIVEKLK